MSAQATGADMTEKEWQSQVIELATMLGFRHYFTYRSKRSPAGWPDLALVRERLVLAELKREGGRLSDSQRSWLRDLLAAGVETYVCRPSDLELLGKVLSYRGDPFAPLALGTPAAAPASVLRDATRRECRLLGVVE